MDQQRDLRGKSSARRHRGWRAAIAALIVLSSLAACGTGSPAPSAGTATGDASLPTASDPGSAPPEATDVAATPTLAATAPPSADTPAQAGATVFTVVLADGPRQGTWQVEDAPSAVPLCNYFPDRDAWTATHLGPPPMSFVDAATGSDRDPSFMVKFTDEPDELGILPSGDVTFEVDDRGETATLTWVSEANSGSSFDSQGVKTGDVELGRVELTIECGSVFRYE